MNGDAGRWWWFSDKCTQYFVSTFIFTEVKYRAKCKQAHNDHAISRYSVLSWLRWVNAKGQNSTTKAFMPHIASTDMSTRVK
jgi:hypothetical protein